MRPLFFALSPWQAAATAVALGLCFAGCRSPASAHRDQIQDSAKACDKGNGSACFYAGSLAAEGVGPSTPEPVKYWTKGCVLKSAESCDALATVKGSLREGALAAGCNGGDLVSCNRRAGEFAQDDKGAGEARALRQAVCKTAAAIGPNTPGRDLRGAAEACAGLARMVAEGKGGGKDELAAVKLDVLATTLRTEALFRHEHEQDGKPPPTILPPEPQVVPGRVKRGGPTPEQLTEKDRSHREAEVSKGALEAWINGVATSMAAVSKSERAAMMKDPSMPTFNPVDRAMSGATTTSAVSATKCQTCVDGCGNLERCMADDFAGGRCTQHRCGPGASCPAFDACVAECTAKADTCAKGCGDCSAEAAKGK